MDACYVTSTSKKKCRSVVGWYDTDDMTFCQQAPFFNRALCDDKRMHYLRSDLLSPLTLNMLNCLKITKDVFTVPIIWWVLFNWRIPDSNGATRYVACPIPTGDPLHSRAACTQPCNVNTHSRAHCSPGARLCEQWGHGCENNGARLCTSAWLCRGSPVIPTIPVLLMPGRRKEPGH